MNIIKCDKCGKKRNDKNRSEWTRISIDSPSLCCKNFDLCEKCGSGILNILKRNFKVDKK